MHREGSRVSVMHREGCRVSVNAQGGAQGERECMGWRRVSMNAQGWGARPVCPHWRVHRVYSPWSLGCVRKDSEAMSGLQTDRNSMFSACPGIDL